MNASFITAQDTEPPTGLIRTTIQVATVVPGRSNNGGVVTQGGANDGAVGQGPTTINVALIVPVVVVGVLLLTLIVLLFWFFRLGRHLRSCSCHLPGCRKSATDYHSGSVETSCGQKERDEFELECRQQPNLGHDESGQVNCQDPVKSGQFNLCLRGHGSVWVRNRVGPPKH